MRYILSCLLWVSLSCTGCTQFENSLRNELLSSDCATPAYLPAKAVISHRTRTQESPDLPVPIFSPQGGALPFGDTVQLIAATMPAGAILEYSYDEGETWITGASVSVVTKCPILARTRVNQLTSNPARANFTYYFERVLVVGNSIMTHTPVPRLGWLNFNGMAASAPEKDFVHILTRRLETLHAPVNVYLQVGTNFELNYGKATYSLDEFDEPLRQFKPDLIVVRLGENVDEREVKGRNFDLQFRRLLERLTATNHPAKIICTTSVWYRPQVDAIVRKVITEKRYSLVDLSSMVGQRRYVASQYKDPGVAAHPNDAGMQRIADLIWAKIP